MDRTFKVGDVFYIENTITKVDEEGNWLECDSQNIYDYTPIKISEDVKENVKMDYERAYKEMVDENIFLKSQIRRYEEVVQTLAIINFTQGRQNS